MRRAFFLWCIQILKSRNDEDDEVTETTSTLDGPTLRKSRRVSFAERDEVRSVGMFCHHVFFASVSSFVWLERIQFSM